MSPGALGGADNSPQVVGVGNFVANHHQGRFPPVRSLLQDVLHRGVPLGGSYGDDALMAAGFAHGVQLPPVRLHHHDPRPLRLGDDAAQGVVRLPPGDVQLIHGGSGPQGLGDRVAALDELLLGGPLLIFSHTVSFRRPRPGGFPGKYSRFRWHLFVSISQNTRFRKGYSQKFHRKSTDSPCGEGDFVIGCTLDVSGRRVCA